MASGNSRIPIAVICNSVPPYRLHLHRRISRELTDVLLWTVRTHDEDSRWPKAFDGREIGLVTFPAGINCGSLGGSRRLIREWNFGGRLIEWVRKAGVRAVVLCGYNDLARARLLVWCRWRRIPCLLSGDSNIQDDVAVGHRRLAKRLVLRPLLKFCAAVLPFGTAGKLYFEDYGVPAKRIYFFPLEPDYRAIQLLGEQQIDDVRQQYGLTRDRCRLLFCGRLVPIKRVDLVIDAFCRIAQQRPLWDLVIVGDGPLGSQLRQRVPQNLCGRVIWTGHVDAQDRVAALQRCCDVLVLPSDREPWGLVMNEAMAAGMAIVSSSVPGAVVDLVQDHRNGRIFAPGNLRELEHCLLDVTEDQRLAAMKAESQLVLNKWIDLADPVRGLRNALNAVGVI